MYHVEVLKVASCPRQTGQDDVYLCVFVYLCVSVRAEGIGISLSLILKLAWR